MSRRDRYQDPVIDLVTGTPLWAVPISAGFVYALLEWILPLVGGFSWARAWAPVATFAVLMLLLLGWFRGWEQRRLLRISRSLEALIAMPSRDFEKLVAEVYRREGYATRENYHASADGGVDLELSRDGRRYLVQCKRWDTSRRIQPEPVRALWGNVADEEAYGAIFVTTSSFTKAAREWAAGKPLELVDGPTLFSLIKKVQAGGLALPDAAGASPMNPPTCPVCESSMMERANRQTHERFWGCSSFPACRGSRPMGELKQPSESEASGNKANPLA